MPTKRCITIMKKITLIDCYISSTRILEKLESMVKTLKNNGEDVFIISNTIIPPHIQSLSDYCFYDKNNRLFENDYEGVTLLDIWKGFDKGGIHEMEPAFQRHGLSVMVNLFNGLELSKELGYTHFQRLEIDDLFGEKSWEFMKTIPNVCVANNKKGLFYVNEQTNSNNNDASFHYMFCEIEYFLNKIPKISNEVDYQNYIIQKWGEKKFIPVETFIYNALSLDNNNDIMCKDGLKDMELDFEDTYWNSETTGANLSPKYQGCSTRIYNCEGCDNPNTKMILTFNYKDKSLVRDVKIYYRDGSNEKITHKVGNKGHFNYTEHSKEIEKIEVYEDGNLLYDEYNQNIYSYVEFTIF